MLNCCWFVLLSFGRWIIFPMNLFEVLVDVFFALWFQFSKFLRYIKNFHFAYITQPNAVIKFSRNLYNLHFTVIYCKLHSWLVLLAKYK